MTAEWTVGLLVASYNRTQRDFGAGVVNTRLTTHMWLKNSGVKFHSRNKVVFMNHLSEVLLKWFFCAFADQDTWHNRLLYLKGAKKMSSNGIRNNWHMTLQMKRVKKVAWGPS